MFVKVIQSQKQSFLTMLFKWLGFLGDSQFSLIVAEIPNSEGPNPQSQSTEKKPLNYCTSGNFSESDFSLKIGRTDPQ